VQLQVGADCQQLDLEEAGVVHGLPRVLVNERDCGVIIKVRLADEAPGQVCDVSIAEVLEPQVCLQQCPYLLQRTPLLVPERQPDKALSLEILRDWAAHHRAWRRIESGPPKYVL
jgi:hypothetical protein